MGKRKVGGRREGGQGEIYIWSYTLATTLSHTKLVFVDTKRRDSKQQQITLFSSTTSIQSAFSSWVDALKKYVQS